LQAFLLENKTGNVFEGKYITALQYHSRRRREKCKICNFHNLVLNAGTAESTKYGIFFVKYGVKCENKHKNNNKTLHFFPKNSLTYGGMCFKIIEYVRIPAKLPGLYRFN